jgi:capsular polysaccharide biosynthesis protein
VYLLYEPQYEASALLEINETTPYIAFQLHEGGVSKPYFQTQMGIIRSPWILGRAVISESVKDLPEIRRNQPDQVEWLRKRISVNPIGDSDLFEIRYASANPESAYLVVNEVTRQYMLAQDEEDARHYRNIMEAALVVKQNQERIVNDLLKQLGATGKNSVAGPETGQIESNELAKNPVSVLQGRLIDVQVERAMVAARIKAMEEEVPVAEAMAAQAQNSAQASATAEPAKNSKPVLTAEQKELRDHLVEMQLNATPEVKQLESQLLAQRIALARLEKSGKTGKNDPLYKQTQDEIAVSESILEDLRRKLRPRLEKDIEFTLRTRPGDTPWLNLYQRSPGPVGGGGELATRGTQRDDLRHLKVELRGFEIAEENLRAAYSAQLSRAFKEREQRSGENLNMKLRKDELADAQAVMARISERVIALQTERAAPPRVVLHDAARKPEAPIEILPIRNMALAAAVGFCLPYAAGFIALLWWNIRLLIGKLEPIPAEAAGGREASAAATPKSGSQ